MNKKDRVVLEDMLDALEELGAQVHRLCEVIQAQKVNVYTVPIPTSYTPRVNPSLPQIWC